MCTREEMLDERGGRYPADHYVIIDDKLRLSRRSRRWGPRVDDVFVRQGPLRETDPDVLATYPPAKVSVRPHRRPPLAVPSDPTGAGHGALRGGGPCRRHEF